MTPVSIHHADVLARQKIVSPRVAVQPIDSDSSSDLNLASTRVKAAQSHPMMACAQVVRLTASLDTVV